MIRVFIIDHHDIVRMALETRLASAVGLDIISSTGDYEAAIQKAQHFHPDVILLETKAPSGMDTLKMLTQTLPQSAILILTSYPDSQEEDATLQLGAAGYVLKTLDTKALVQKIRTCARQEPADVKSSIPAMA